MTLDAGRFSSAELSTPVSRETAAESTADEVFAAVVIEQVEILAKYSGYIERQKDEVERSAHYEHLKLPDELDYMLVTALGFEARQKLTKFRPETLGMASRISGITPATISLLLVHLKKSNFKGFVAAGKLAKAGLAEEGSAQEVKA
jgi:tRNA uridine 5-carboxymethylaminomethyl modification enzyme